MSRKTAVATQQSENIADVNFVFKIMPNDNDNIRPAERSSHGFPVALQRCTMGRKLKVGLLKS